MQPLLARPGNATGVRQPNHSRLAKYVLGSKETLSFMSDLPAHVEIN